jgi:CheY-like chemotaxis protein
MGTPKPFGRKVLVVDDDEDVREVTRTALELDGHTVLSAANGRDALALVDAHPDIALLFTDIVMPGAIDGFDLAERAKRKRPRLHVIYTSGYFHDEGVCDGLLLKKPWTPEDLKSALGEFAAKRNPKLAARRARA